MHTQVSSNATVLNTAALGSTDFTWEDFSPGPVEKIKHTKARAHTNKLFCCIRRTSYVASYRSLMSFLKSQCV